MKYLIILFIIAIIFISGCDILGPRDNYPRAYPTPARIPAEYTTTSTTSTTSTTVIFDCKSCPERTICRNNECIKVEYSNTEDTGSLGTY